MKSKPLFVFIVGWLLAFFLAVSPLSAQIDFSANQVSGCAPLLVQLTATGAPDSSLYEWNFGKGPAAPTKSPVVNHVFTDVGSYTITLRVKTPDGVWQPAVVKTKYITLSPPLNPTITVSPSIYSCSYPYLATIKDLTSGGEEWEWNIEGNTYYRTDNTIPYWFSKPDTATIKLRVKRDNCISYIEKSIFISPTPTLDFSTTLEAQKSGPATLTVTPHFDLEGLNLSSVTWNFPGGSPSAFSGLSPDPVTYNDISKAKDVTVTVKTAEGCIFSFTKPKLVQNYVAFASSANCMNHDIALKLISNFPQGVDVANNIVTAGGQDAVAIQNDTFYFRFDKIGKKAAELQFRYDTSGHFDTFRYLDLWDIQGPIATFTSPRPNTCKVGDTLIFKATPQTTNGQPSNYIWRLFSKDHTDSLKEGLELPGSPFNTGNTAQLSYGFKNAGLYSVVLQVYGANGCTDSTARIGYVKVGKPSSLYTQSSPEICLGDTFVLRSLQRPTAHFRYPYYIKWEVRHSNGLTVYTSTAEVFKVPIREPGVYDIRYTIGNDTVCATTIFKKAALKVTGVTGDFDIPGRNNCPGNATQLNFTVRNRYPGTSVPVRYKWDITPRVGVALSDSFAASPYVTFQKAGIYRVSLRIGFDDCDTLYRWEKTITIGTKAHFNLPKVACTGQGFKPNYGSLYNPTRVKWEITPSTYVISSDSATEPVITFLKDDCYTVTLKTFKLNNPACTDSLSRTICSQSASAAFTTDDTVLTCAPAGATFVATTYEPGYTYKWIFGDGTVFNTEKPRTTHFFDKPNHKGYDVTLIATNPRGCKDSVTIKNLVIVYGPVANFQAHSKPGCGATNVTFTVDNPDNTSYFFDAQDGSPVRNTIPEKYTYYHSDSTREVVTYYPFVALMDSTGCFSYEADTVQVYRVPKLDFRASAQNGCVPMTVKFENLTKYGKKFQWDLDGDGTVDLDSFNAEYTYTKGGNYTVRLFVETAMGCKEVLTRSGFITAYQKPEVSIQRKTNTVCYGDTQRFEPKFQLNIPIARYEWDFGDGAFADDTSDQWAGAYVYRTPGYHQVRLYVTTPNGCRDTAYFDSVFVRDTVPVKPVGLKYVTVTDDNKLRVVWDKTNWDIFVRYELYQQTSSGDAWLFSSREREDTVYQFGLTNAALQSGYKVRETNQCNDITAFSRLHKPILLTIEKPGQRMLKLSWTPYVGWDNVASYTIYRRMGDKGSYQQLIVLGGNDTTYTDRPLCDTPYYYYIVATDASGTGYITQSNRAHAIPDFVALSTPEIRYSTVIKNRKVLTKWEDDNSDTSIFYTIHRYTEGRGWQYDFATTRHKFYIDTSADVQGRRYQYQVQAADDCGHRSATSNKGSNILLKGQMGEDDRARLEWSPYVEWPMAVERYRIEQVVATDENYVLGQNNGGNYQFTTDTAYYGNRNAELCFRIRAIESGSLPDSSVSNTICLRLPSRIFIPNAFSPNDDGHNDVFRPNGTSLSLLPGGYEMHIYNRWGQEVFATTDLEKGWDGTVNGQGCPIGAYLYQIKVIGTDGIVHSRIGTLQLLW